MDEFAFTRRCALAVVVIVLGLAARAPAETVFLRVGMEGGQGWLFKAGATCWVLTAGHVVPPGSSPVIVGGGGRQGVARAESIVRSSDDDLAFMRVDDGALATDCPAVSYGQTVDAEDASFDELLHRQVSLELERRSVDQLGATTASGGLKPLTLTLDGVGDVKQRIEPGMTPSHVFSFHASDAVDAHIVTKGFSGSPILLRGGSGGEAGVPLGIEYEVVPGDRGEHDLVLAVRMSTARAFFEARSPGLERVSASAASVKHIVDAHGIPLDSACGPLAMFDAGSACGWRVQRTAIDDPIRVQLDLGARLITTAVVVQFAAPAPRGIAVSTALTIGPDSDWVENIYCPVAPGATEVRCAVGERFARTVRVIVDGEKAEIRALRVETDGSTKYR